MQAHRLSHPLRSLLVSALLAACASVQAEQLAVHALMVPKEQIKLDFQDGSGHFVLMVRREGNATGSGLFDGARVVEFGRHDILPGVSGDPSGYLVVTCGPGNIAYLKWTVRSIFLPNREGRPEMHDNGFWEVVSGTGRLKGLKGTGTLQIESAGETDRLFVLDGQLALARP
jgi:hypothetical protein